MRLLRTRWALALLVLVDLAIVVGAILVIRGNVVPASSDSSDGSDGIDTSSQAGTPSEGAIVGPLVLAGSPNGTLVRATRGTCDTRGPKAPQVWVATRALGPLKKTTITGVSEILGVKVTDARITLVGADAACKPVGVVSTDKGATWKVGKVPGGIYWVDVDTTSQKIHGPAPGKTRNAGCQVGAVSNFGSGAAVACSDTGIALVDTGGAGDRVTPSVSPQTTAVVERAGKAPFLLSQLPTCSAAVVIVSQQDQNQKTISCLGNGSAPLGMARVGGDVVAQVGQKLLYSTNGARDFKAYPGA